MNVVKSLAGIDPNSIGLRVLRETARPGLPSTRDRVLTIPGRNGAWDFGADMEPRSFSLECAFLTRRSTELQQSIETLASLLVDAYGRPKTVELVFSSRPDRSYRVRYSGSLPIQRVAGLGKFSLPMVAFDPYPRSITGSDDVILDSDILLDSDVRLDDQWSFTVSAAGTYQVDNWGTLALEPEIVVSGSFSTLAITSNGKTFSYNSAISGQTLTIDCEKMTVKLNGTNALAGMSGNFIALLPGINQVSIGGTGLNCSVSFNFHPKFV